MEGGNIGVNIVGGVCSCPKVRVIFGYSFFFQFTWPVDIRKNRFGTADEFLEELPVFLTGRGVVFIGQILLQLFYVGRHFLRIADLIRIKFVAV